MKRFFFYSPIALFSFLVGISLILITTYNLVNPPKSLPQKPTEKFAVNLERINLEDVGFFDVADLGDNKILSLAVQDGMRISKDGGRTWELMFVENGGNPPHTDCYGLQTLDFVNSQKGWASGSCLVSTNDGGKTWKKVKLPRWMDKIEVKFLNESIGYVAGSIGVRDRKTDITTYGIEIYKTTDGGKTWRKSYSDKTSIEPWKMITPDENTALVIVNGNILLRTENGGKSWQKVYERLYGGVKSVSKSLDGKLWLFGKNNIMTSGDFGKTWQKPDDLDENIINHDWWEVDFNDAGIGVAVSEDSAIALTKDGGKTWSNVKSNLHADGTMPVPNNPFNECLRGIHIFKNSGIITGSQKDYIITFPE